MKKRYECQPYPSEKSERPLIFDWDRSAGIVDGEGARHILQQIAMGGVVCRPNSWPHAFSADPLKSLTDMAAIVGERWYLPDDLKPFYPQIDEDPSDLPPGAIIG